MITEKKALTRFSVAVISAACLLIAALPGYAEQNDADSKVAGGSAEYPSVDPSFLSALEWRLIGPFRGGRVPAVAGDPIDPLVFYMGTSHGGVWKTTDAGTYWRNVSDDFFRTSPVGAMAVSRSNPGVVYVGMGESSPRQNLTPGDGVYKSTDGGKTWTHVGLADTRHISKVRIHPTNPDIAYVAAMGDIFGTNPERGVYRTKDGGSTWQRVLYKSERACAVDLSLDPTNPDVLFASLNQFQRFPWDESSGGPDSGLHKSTDGGDTWTEITRNPGLPTGVVGKIGVAISPPQPNRVYAIFEAAEGGVFRSDDGGATWRKVYDDREQRREASSYLHITAHPQDPDTVYVQHVQVWKSTDGGSTFNAQPMGHSDHHSLWIDPNNPQRIIDGGDGGAAVSMNGGTSWSTLDNQPTAELFSLAIDDQEPYWLYAAQNDNSHIAIPSRTDGRAIGWPDYLDIGGGEGGQTAVKPDGSVVYACDRTTMVRYDRLTKQTPNISVWPEDEFGAAPKDVKYRFYYSFPVLLSPHDSTVLYTAAQSVFRTNNEGESWRRISPDLTRNRVDKMQKIPGGPITSLASSLFYVSLIRTIAESPLERGELWIGTDDSTVQVSRNTGQTWDDVSPPEMPEWTTITAIDVSPHERGTAYLAANRVRVSDRTPYFYKTTDYGRSWQSITTGIREHDFSHVIREDPGRRGLLYAGTETGAYVSFNAGASWQSLQRNLPPVPVSFMLVKNNDLVVATHGRGLWIMDNLTALRQITSEVTNASVHLFEVAPTTRRMGGRRSSAAIRARPGLQFTSASGKSAVFEVHEGPDGQMRRTYLDAGQNPPGGVMIEYYLKQPPAGEASLTITDAAGEVIRKFSNQAKEGLEMPALAGMNRFFWDMQYPNARLASSSVQLAGFEASRPVPPIATPGHYAVRLTVSGQTYEQPFEIGKDPRITASDSDLQAQFALMVKIRDKVSEVTDALNKLRDARRKLETSSPSGKQVDAVKEELRTIEGRLTRLTGSHSLEMGPKGLTNKLGTLSRAVVRADAKPTQQMVAVFEDLSTRIAAELSRLDELIASSSTTR